MSFATLEFPRTDAVVRQLPNGLEVIIKEDPSVPLVSVQAWVKTGSCFEEDHVGAGISHLVEHMVFKGTKDNGPSELARRVQAIGGYMNAYTSFDRTVYYVDCPLDGAEVALDVVTDLVQRAAFPEAEFEKEKDVIRREIDMGEDDPGSKNSHTLFETIFRTHPMGQPIIGHLELFNGITYEQMVAYYRRHYVPNNMFWVIVGPVTEEQVMSWIEARFGDQPRALYTPPQPAGEPEQLGRRERHIEFTTELSKLTLAWRVPGLTHADIPALEVLGEILGHGRSSRLFRRVKEEKRLVHAIGSGCYAPPPGGIFSVSAELDFQNKEAAYNEIMAVLQEVREKGVNIAEVAKAQRQVLSSQLSSLTTVSGIASDLGSNWFAARNLDFTRDFVASINAVSPGDVQRVANTYLKERTLTVTSLNPRGSLTQQAAHRPHPKKSEVQRHVLPNGLTVLFKEDHRVPTVSFYTALRGGSLAETDATAGLTRLMSRSLLKGSATRSAEEIANEIEEAGGHIGADSGGSSWSIHVDVMRPDASKSLALLADVLRTPAFPEVEVAREKELQLAGIRADQDRLTSVAFKELRKSLFGPHPFALERNGTPESLANLAACACHEFHERLTVGGNAVLSIFGDIDAERMKDEVEKHFELLSAGLVS